MNPYYQDENVTLYHGDCREVDAWESAHLLLTDPPYGIAWKPQSYSAATSIVNDLDTTARDDVIGRWFRFDAHRRPQPWPQGHRRGNRGTLLRNSS